MPGTAHQESDNEGAEGPGRIGSVEEILKRTGTDVSAVRGVRARHIEQSVQQGKQLVLPRPDGCFDLLPGPVEVVGGEPLAATALAERVVPVKGQGEGGPV